MIEWAQSAKHIDANSLLNNNNQATKTQLKMNSVDGAWTAQENHKSYKETTKNVEPVIDALNKVVQENTAEFPLGLNKRDLIGKRGEENSSKSALRSAPEGRAPKKFVKKAVNRKP